MGKVVITTFFIAFCFCLTSCKSTAKILSTIDDIDGEWIVTFIGEEDVRDYEDKATIIFNIQERRVSGNAGCNSFFADIKSIDNDKLELSSIGSTKRLCKDMNLEHSVLRAINQVEKFEINQDKELLLKDSQKKVLLKLKQKP